MATVLPRTGRSRSAGQKAGGAPRGDRPRIGRDPALPGCDSDVMLFDGPADLPTATLRSRASAARHRVIAADLLGWLATRWRWLRPRTVPLLVAFVGMLAVLGATKYLTAYAGGDPQIRAAVHSAPVEITIDSARR